MVISLVLYTKVCRWCNHKFTTRIKNKLYCSEEHRKFAHLENQRKYDQQKRDKQPSKPGTIKLSEHRNENFETETKIIHKEYIRTFSGAYNKGKQKDWSIDQSSLLFSYDMVDCYPCPQCKGDIRLRDISRSEISCRICGLVISGPPINNVRYPETNGRMAATNFDVLISESTKDPKTGHKKSSVRDIAWNRFYNPDKYKK